MKILVSLALLLSVGACTAAPSSPPAASNAPTALGVQVDTDKGVLKLDAFYYGMAVELPVGTTPITVPRVDTVNQFIVNIPGASPSDAAVYWTIDLDHIWAHGQVPVHSEVKPLGSGGAFSITTPNLAGKKTGHAMLVLKNVNKGAPRYYAVGLGPKPSLGWGQR